MTPILALLVFFCGQFADSSALRVEANLRKTSRVLAFANALIDRVPSGPSRANERRDLAEEDALEEEDSADEFDTNSAGQSGLEYLLEQEGRFSGSQREPARFSAVAAWRYSLLRC